jgi:hypothetical protein
LNQAEEEAEEEELAAGVRLSDEHRIAQLRGRRQVLELLNTAHSVELERLLRAQGRTQTPEADTPRTRPNSPEPEVAAPPGPATEAALQETLEEPSRDNNLHHGRPGAAGRPPGGGLEREERVAGTAWPRRRQRQP